MRHSKTWKALATAIVVASISYVTPVAGADPQWASVWTANPSGTTGVIPPGTQVLREIISPRRAGETVRLRLTNREGTLPVTFAQVWIGTQDKGADLIPGSNRRLSFNGQPSVTIPPGRDVVSDPIDYPVMPFTKVAISMQAGLLGIPPASSSHSVSRETNYFSIVLPLLGGGAGTTSGAGFQPFTLTAGVTFQASWHYIAGLDVAASGKPRTIVAFGDSITDGLTVNPVTGNTFIENIATLGRDQRYPDFLQRRFGQMPQYKSFSIVNAGIAGNRLTEGPFAPFFGPKGLDRLATDVVAVPGVTDVIVHMGINDIAFDLPAQTVKSRTIATTLTNGFATLINQLHAKGIRVVLATIMPAKGAGLGMFSPALNSGLVQTVGLSNVTPPVVNGGALHGTEITDSIRKDVNAWILSMGNTLADGVIDFDACMRDPQNPSFINPAYNSGDNLHPNAQGYAAMADCVEIARVFP